MRPAVSWPALAALLLDDEGRIPRRTFWMYVACAIGFAGVLLVALPAFGLPRHVAPLVGSVALIYPGYCIIAKRLQDIGIAGQWGLVLTIIAAVDALWLALGPGLSPAMVALRSLWWWASLASTICFILIGLLPGDQRANRFGPVP